MRQIPQLVYILLYLQSFARDARTFDGEILSGGNASVNADDETWIGEWRCDSDDECTTANSTCRDRLCQCAPGYIYNADMTSCIRVAAGPLDSCEETLACSAYLFSGARCVDSVCVCSPGYYYLHGRCNRYVGLFEKCKRNIDCYVNADVEASTCDRNEGVCKCSPGFYQREYRTCRREGKADGDECTIDLDCKFDNARCDKFRCVTSTAEDVLVELSFDDAPAIDDFAEKEIRVGSDCTTNEDCAELGKAVCGPSGTCRCGRAHFASEKGDKCVAELGEPCPRKDDFSVDIKKAFCREGRWSCTNGTVATKYNRECRRATRKYGENCNLDEQCHVFGPDAECRDKKCVCNERSHYVESENFCWGNRAIGEECKQDRDCYVEGFKGELVCNGTCGCPNGKRLNKHKTACIDNISTGLDGVCEVNEDCATPNSVCEKEVCTCAKNYYRSKDQCLAGVNSTCARNEDCKASNSVCTSKLCTCKPKYVAAAVDSCLPVSSYGGKCSADIQCSINITRAICAKTAGRKDGKDVAPGATESGICVCSEGNHYRHGKCLKKRLLGETCTNIEECYLSANQKRVVCMNGRCECDWGYARWNDSVCVRDTRVVLLTDGGATNVASAGLLSIVLLAPFLQFSLDL